MKRSSILLFLSSLVTVGCVSSPDDGELLSARVDSEGVLFTAKNNGWSDLYLAGDATRVLEPNTGQSQILFGVDDELVESLRTLIEDEGAIVEMFARPTLHRLGPGEELEIRTNLGTVSCGLSFHEDPEDDGGIFWDREDGSELCPMGAPPPGLEIHIDVIAHWENDLFLKVSMYDRPYEQHTELSAPLGPLPTLRALNDAQLGHLEGTFQAHQANGTQAAVE